LFPLQAVTDSNYYDVNAVIKTLLNKVGIKILSLSSVVHY